MAILDDINLNRSANIGNIQIICGYKKLSSLPKQS